MYNRRKTININWGQAEQQQRNPVFSTRIVGNLVFVVYSVTSKCPQLRRPPPFFFTRRLAPLPGLLSNSRPRRGTALVLVPGEHQTVSIKYFIAVQIYLYPQIHASRQLKRGVNMVVQHVL